MGQPWTRDPGEEKSPSEEGLVCAPPARHGFPGLLSCLGWKETPGATWAVSLVRPSGPGGRTLPSESHDPRPAPDQP